MNWIILALIAPLAWSIANYIDKFILSRSQNDEGGSGGLMVLSSLVSLVIVIILFILYGSSTISIGANNIFILVLSGIFEALYILFYFWALERESTTTVISLFQFSPIMGLVFGYILLHEIPTSMQIFAVILILIGTLCIVWKKNESLSLKKNILLLMLVSTAFVGVYNTLFKLVAEQVPFWTSVFWQYLGIVFVGLVLFIFVSKYRKQAIYMMSKKTLFTTTLAELMNVIALLATNMAILFAPVALVLSISSVQPIFVLIEGFIIVALFPNLLDKSERPSLKLSYILGILLVCMGGFLIYMF